MDREQVIEEARRLAAQGDIQAACVLRWLAPGETPPHGGAVAGAEGVGLCGATGDCYATNTRRRFRRCFQAIR